ncbi:MAG: CHAT domain-containing protein, partial [Candidatus Rokuibacteriota bacterium]
VLDTTGHHAEAEALCRKIIALLDVDRGLRQHPWLDEVHSYLALTLMRQGRLLEAENAARSAARGALARRGRFSPHTAWMLRSLVSVLLEQQRYREAETLARVVVDMFERTGTAPESLRLATARADLARALASQGRDRESLREYDVIRAGLRRDPASLRQFFDGHVGYAELLLKTGSADAALAPLTVALQESRRLVGDGDRQTAAIRASLARAYAVSGDVSRALDEFGEAVPTLLKRLSDVEDEAAPSWRPDPRLVVTLGAYMGLLADTRGTPHERERGIDATAEAFRLADAARARAVQRAVDANAVRAAVHRPGLAEVVRRKQDTKNEIAALYDRLADALSQPRPEQDTKVISELRDRIEALRNRSNVLTTQVETEFPAYAELVNPKPVTLAQARAMLQPGEALIATLVTRDRTFVWAVPHAGPVAFAAPPIGAEEIETTIATLRKALEPGAATLGDIPDFDLALAHRLYSSLLEPVRSGWHDARVVFVVANGALGQLPLALLPTRPTALPPESGALFSNYRQVPWLARTHAVVVLPSVGSLATLRALPPGEASRRPFVGFGDPWFSHEQAALAAAGGATRPRDAVALTTRSMPLTLRNAPRTFDSSDLHRLPPLPETAEEIQSIATAMRADPGRDVFVGARANEETVKTLDLAGYRVIAFATHGLVAGDLEGLTQPALALSAPDVAGVDGDGLLTLDEILALRLDADWIVLSACNTAAGDGAGADAVSGLGRAFFYAGARALLVSNWPVETTSARALTTQLFRQGPRMSRAEALQATMKWMIDEAEFVDGESGKIVFSYAHPIFWAPFTLVGDGGGAAATEARNPMIN